MERDNNYQIEIIKKFRQDNQVDYSDSRFSYDIPNEKESGAIEGEWVSGVYTKHGTAEAVISNSGSYKHNNDINTFIKIFGADNVVKNKIAMNKYREAILNNKTTDFYWEEMNTLYLTEIMVSMI